MSLLKLLRDSKEKWMELHLRDKQCRVNHIKEPMEIKKVSRSSESLHL